MTTPDLPPVPRRRTLFVVATEQAVGSLTQHPDGRIEYVGAAEPVLSRIRQRLGDEAAATLVLEEGWSNGYLYFGPLHQPEEEEG